MPPRPTARLPACSTLGESAIKTEPTIEQFFVLRATTEEMAKLPLERQVRRLVHTKQSQNNGLSASTNHAASVSSARSKRPIGVHVRATLRARRHAFTSPPMHPACCVADVRAAQAD